MNRIVPGVIWLIIWISSWLPGFILRFISSAVHYVVFGLMKYRSEVIKDNINRSLPELPAPERQRIVRQFQRHFSELFLEMVLFTRLKSKAQTQRIKFINPEILTEAFGKKQNIIIISGHYGNWEWNLLPILRTGYRVLAIYKPQTSRLADRLMKNIRDKPGLILVPMKDTLRVITREIKENKSPFAILLVADQIPARPEIRFWTPFLNQETAFFTGGEKLARRFGMPVLYADQVKKKFAEYSTRITPVYDGHSETGEGDVTREFVRLLEESIRREPYLWLWSHRRWKYRKEDLPLQA